MRRLLRLLSKTTVTPMHICIGIAALVLYSCLLLMTHPFGWMASAIFVIVAGLWSVLIEPRWVRRREFTHPVSQLHQSSAIKLAIVGDLHIGSPYATLEALQKLLTNILIEKPDVLILVGDYVIQGVIGGTHVPISDVVNLLKTVDIPCVGIIGNHDVKDGRSEIHAAFSDSSIHFIENASVTLNINGQDVLFIGLDDESTGEPKPDEAFPTRPEDTVVVCLAHDPATFLREMPYRSDLCLAGHTHAGQVRIPGIGALVLPGKSPLTWSYGWVDTKSGPLYVTSGFGTSIAPIRFCAPPEYVFIRLDPDSSEV